MARPSDFWFRRMTARLRGAAQSQVGQELIRTAVHALDSRAVLTQDAEVTAKLLQNLGPLLASLQPTPDAVVRVGALLVVKENGVVTVRQLTSAQQLLLDHAPHLETSPRETLRTLRLAESATPPLRVGSAHLELIGDGARNFPAVPMPQRYFSARIVHCAYETLAPLSVFTNLLHLEIAAYPDETLEPIGHLTQLEELSILHFPRVSDLSPVAKLANLRRLDLMTLPSLDTDVNVMEVVSLAPLCALPRLEELTLLGVRPPDQRVDDLLKCNAMRTATITGYPDLEVERLKESLVGRE
jgi:hypothetical protein